MSKWYLDEGIDPSSLLIRRGASSGSEGPTFDLKNGRYKLELHSFEVMDDGQESLEEIIAIWVFILVSHYSYTGKGHAVGIDLPKQVNSGVVVEVFRRIVSQSKKYSAQMYVSEASEMRVEIPATEPQKTEMRG